MLTRQDRIMILPFFIAIILTQTNAEKIGRVVGRPGGPSSCRFDATISYHNVLMLKPEIQPWTVIWSTEGEILILMILLKKVM